MFSSCPRTLASRLVPLILAVGLVVAVPEGAAPSIASPVPAAVPSVSDASSAPDVLGALKIASKFGHRVEVSSLDAGSSTTFVNPDGAMSAELSSTPVRVQQNERWVPVDTTLVVRGDGSVGPKASTAAVTLGGAGSRTIAKLAVGSGVVTYGWQSPLPEPVLAGSVATYRDVLPDVDIVASVTTTGVETSMVFKSRQAAAAAAAVDWPMTVTGLSASVNAAHTVSYADSAGIEMARTPAPQAWDARLGSSVSGPADGPSVRAVTRLTTANGAVLAPPGPTLAGTVTTASGALTATIEVPPTLLNDPATVYPLVLDPSVECSTCTENLHGYVENDGDTEINTSFDGGEVHVGTFDGGGTVTRGLYSFAQGPTHGATINSATLQLWNNWAYNCTAQSMTVYKSSSFTTATTWPNPGVVTANAVAKSFAHGYSSSCAAAEVDFDVKSIAADFANDSGSSRYYFQLRAGSESSSSYWKKFDPIAVLDVTYDRVPNAPSNVGFKSAFPSRPGCATGSGRPTIDGSVASSWQAKFTDPDGHTVRGQFQYWDLATPSTTHTLALTGSVASGSYASVGFAGNTTTFVDGHNYGFHVRGYDGQLYGAWSSTGATCEFHVTDPPPNTPSGLEFADPSLDCGSALRGDLPIELAATVSDPDGKYGKHVRAVFSLTPTASGAAWTYTSPWYVSSTTKTIITPQIPANTINDHTAFTWTVKADNGQKASSTVSCTGSTDNTTPAQPAVVGGGVFGTPGSASGHIGDVDTITLSTSDGAAAKYVWAIADQPLSELPSPGACGSIDSNGNHTVCSSQGTGWDTMQTEAQSTDFTVSAQAYSSAGTPSPIGSQTFEVSEWSPSHEWLTDGLDVLDPPASIVDQLGGPALNVNASGTSWVNDGTSYGTALHLDGQAGEADTGAGGPAVTVDMAHGFAVGVWVRPDVASNSSYWDVALAQDGDVISGFWLGQVGGYWGFCMPHSQAAPPQFDGDCAWVAQPVDTAQYVGQWTQLTAVWDNAATQMRLYVNGTLTGPTAVVAHTATASSAGALTVGRYRYGADYPGWSGDILDPITYPGVIDEQRVSLLVGCGPPNDPNAFCN